MALSVGKGVGELAAGGSALSKDASKYTNNADVEMQWAMKTFHHAETYYNLISSVDPTLLKLTKIDDEIYEAFRKLFPDMKVDVVTEQDLKTPEAKEKWRPFCMEFEKRVEDYNFGTLLRFDCTGDYTEENSILAIRVQFLAIEIARNREGLNSPLRLKKKTEQSNAQT